MRGLFVIQDTLSSPTVRFHEFEELSEELAPVYEAVKHGVLYRFSNPHAYMYWHKENHILGCPYYSSLKHGSVVTINLDCWCNFVCVYIRPEDDAFFTIPYFLPFKGVR